MLEFLAKMVSNLEEKLNSDFISNKNLKDWTVGITSDPEKSKMLNKNSQTWSTVDCYNNDIAKTLIKSLVQKGATEDTHDKNGVTVYCCKKA